MIPCWAQKRLSKNERIKLQAAEISRLQGSLDSLMFLVDSLRELNFLEDTIAILERAERADTLVERNIELADSLMGEWYRIRNLRDYEQAKRYNMDSVRFSSDVPDAELRRRLEAMNSYITLPFNETVKNYMVLYSEKMPSRMGRVLGLSTCRP